MPLVAVHSTGLRDPARTAAELAAGVRAGLPPDARVAGGLLWANAAAGPTASRVGEALRNGPWPAAELLGTSFEGVIAAGRSLRDEPAVVLLAWTEGAAEPLPLLFEEAPSPSELTAELLAGRPRPGAGDLLLLLPDALGLPDAAGWLAEVAAGLAPARIVGAAASGLDGGPALAWHGEGRVPGGLVAVLVPAPEGPEGRPGMAGSAGQPGPWRVGASRAASPWLEITACRPRWIDGLEGEPAVDWVRRQLGLDPDESVERWLDRLLVRLRPGGVGPSGSGSGSGAAEADADADAEPASIGCPLAPVDYEERFVVGVDARRGALSVPGAFRRGDRAALALPDAALAREALRAAVGALPATDLVLHLACRARDASLHGDDDLESAIVAQAARAGGLGTVVGAIAPYLIGPCGAGPAGLLVHASLLVAAGSPRAADLGSDFCSIS